MKSKYEWKLGCAVAGLCVAYATAAWAQDARSWRAYGMERNQFRPQRLRMEPGAFTLLGTAAPSLAQDPEADWIDEPRTATNVRDIAIDLIRGIGDDVSLVKGLPTIIFSSGTKVDFFGG